MGRDIRQPRDRLIGQPQERQESAAAGATRDRLPPARGSTAPARLHLAPGIPIVAKGIRLLDYPFCSSSDTLAIMVLAGVVGTGTSYFADIVLMDVPGSLRNVQQFDAARV
jgi:hypothetical protein